MQIKFKLLVIKHNLEHTHYITRGQQWPTTGSLYKAFINLYAQLNLTGIIVQKLVYWSSDHEYANMHDISMLLCRFLDIVKCATCFLASITMKFSNEKLLSHIPPETLSETAVHGDAKWELQFQFDCPRLVSHVNETRAVASQLKTYIWWIFYELVAVLLASVCLIRRMTGQPNEAVSASPCYSRQHSIA